MANFFDKFLRLKYSSDLHQHLKGLDLKCETYSGNDFYPLLYITLLAVCFVIMFNYYYGFFNRPKMANIVAWLLNVLSTSVIFFCWAYFKSSNDLRNHNFCTTLRFRNEDCLMFGLTAAIYAFVACILYSLILKWWSTNNKLIPFKLI